MNNKTILFTLLMLTASLTIQAQDLTKYPWLDRTKTFKERATLLVKELTLEEKAGQLGNIVSDQVTRDGVVILPHYQYWNEAIHGYARMGNATSFPESKGMSATWDPELIYLCADATSTEARAYHKYKTNQRTPCKGWKIGLNVWSPTINMSRDPRWGREEENYGEDPFLCGTMAAEFIKGIQGIRDAANPYYKIVACAKHFAANNYEAGRHSTTSFVTEKNMREYYLPAFEMAVRDADVQSVMAAYNAISNDPNAQNAAGVGASDGKGGLPCSANKMLLTDILRNEWGFTGYVTSDCAAVSDVFRKTKHLYFGNFNTSGNVEDGHDKWRTAYEGVSDDEKMMEARATSLCINAGLNSNCEFYGKSAVLQRALRNAVSDEYKTNDNLGYVNLTEETVDKALIELLTTRFALGEFDEDYITVPWNNVAETDIENAEHQALALRAAQECITLMKNEGNLLPIGTDKKVALIGPYANAIMLGDYSGTPTYTTTPFEAFSKKLNFKVSDGKVEFENYSERIKSQRGEDKLKATAGCLGSTASGDMFAYDNIDFGEGCTDFVMACGAKNDASIATLKFYLDNTEGEPVLTVKSLNTGNWTTFKEVTATVDPTVFKGKHKVIVKICDRNGGETYNKNDQEYCGNFDYFRFYKAGYEPLEEQGPLYMVTTSSTVNDKATDAMIARAVAVAQKADVVIFCGGTDYSKPDSHETGTESHDRWVLTLPGNQADVINALLAVNKNVVVVLETGSSMDLTAIKDVPAIVEAWYGGQAQGQAICDAIYGDINPSGHLTSTWYADINELPQASESNIGRNGSNGMMEYNIDDWGYTYMYYGKATKKQQKGTPQYAFGHGLSYTTFAYSNASATTPTNTANGNVTVTIKNTGNRRGADVIQVYAKFTGSANLGNMNKRLVGFQRVELDPDEEKTVTIPVSYRSLSYYSENDHQYMVEGGQVELQVAESSADADIQQTVTITPAAGVAGETWISTHIDEIPAVTGASQLLKTDHIYTVMGAYVGPASCFDRLPKGVYVLNGVKYIKK